MGRARYAACPGFPQRGKVRAVYSHDVVMYADLKSATIEIWEHLELLEQLTRREIKLRYKQAAMGFAWAVFMPCLIVVSGLIIRYAMS